MSDKSNLHNLIFSFFLLLFFFMFIAGCDEPYQEKFEDYHPWWLEYYQQSSDNEVNDVLVIQEN